MRVNVNCNGQRVGQIQPFKGSHFFEYDVRFLRTGLELSPFTLPLSTGASKHSDLAFQSLPPLIADSLPGKFAREVITERFKKLDRPPPSPLQLLSYLGDRTMGALTYEPADGDVEAQVEIDLIKAAIAARNLQEQVHEERIDTDALPGAQTAGGMAAKVLAAISSDKSEIVTGSSHIPPGKEAWMVKLNTKRAKESSVCQLEMAYFDLARLAGITVPNTFLIPDVDGIEHFGIQRFDRKLDDPNQRIHLHSFAGLLGLDFGETTHDYDQLLRVTRALTMNASQVDAQFVRMVFNLLASVRDDHAKNFSFLMDESGKWSVSPAYDLIYSDNELGGNWTLIGGERSQVTMNHLLELGETHSVSSARVHAIVQQVVEALKEWPRIALERGLGPRVISLVAGVHSQMISNLDRG